MLWVLAVKIETYNELKNRAFENKNAKSFCAMDW